MKFDESMVYNLVNADKVKIGSKGYFSDNLKDLKYVVENDCNERYGEITEIKDDSYETRFKFNTNIYCCGLFYLVEDATFKKYRPYHNTSEIPGRALFKVVVDGHGGYYAIIAVEKDRVYIGAR